MQVRNRITVADLTRSVKVPKKDENGNVVKNDNGQPVMVGLSLNEPQDLYLVFGRAKTYKEGTTQYGKYREYQGTFEARRVADGETVVASKVIFPPPTDALVENEFDAAKKIDESAEVNFAFMIGVEEHRHGDEKKYRFTCKPYDLGGVNKPDPLADLRAVLSAQAPALLPAPPSSAEATEGKPLESDGGDDKLKGGKSK